MTNQGKNAIDLVLAESLKELAVTRPIDKITIKEITDRAGVIRPTFYNHFQDKYELLEWIVEKELMEPAMPLFDNGMLREGLTFMLTAMEREKSFYCKAARLEGQNSFPEVLKKKVAHTVLKYFDMGKLKEQMPYAWLTPELIADFYAQAICHVAIEWAKGGMAIPIAELVEVYLLLIQRSIIDLLEDMQNIT